MCTALLLQYKLNNKKYNTKIDAIPNIYFIIGNAQPIVRVVYKTCAVLMRKKTVFTCVVEQRSSCVCAAIQRVESTVVLVTLSLIRIFTTAASMAQSRHPLFISHSITAA